MGSQQECTQKMQFLKDLVKYADSLDPSVDYLTIPLSKLQQMAKSPLNQQLIEEQGIYQQTLGLVINRLAQTATFIWKIQDLYQIICPILAPSKTYKERGANFKNQYKFLLRDAISSTLQQKGQLSFWTKNNSSELLPVQIRAQFHSFKVEEVHNCSYYSTQGNLKYKLKSILKLSKENPQKIYLAQLGGKETSIVEFALLVFSREANCYELYTFCSCIDYSLKQREQYSRSYYESAMSYFKEEDHKQLNITHVILCTKQEWEAGYELSENLKFCFSPFENFLVKNQKLPQQEMEFKNLRANIIMYKKYPTK